VVEVEIDVLTGEFVIRRADADYDAGKSPNPAVDIGQLEGGFVMGLGAAVLEELVVEDGSIQTLSLADMKIPSVADVPRLRIVQIPTHVGPGAFGAKMAGELTNAPVAPAVANAVAAASGARITELPITAERVHAALKDGSGQVIRPA